MIHCSDEESTASLLASPRAGIGTGAAGRDLYSALSAVEAHLQQLLLNSSSGMAMAANVCSR